VLSLSLSLSYIFMFGSLFVVFFGDFPRPIAIAAPRVLELSSSRCGIPRFFSPFFLGRMADVQGSDGAFVSNKSRLKPVVAE